jgi:hypothetical protein
MFNYRLVIAGIQDDIKKICDAKKLNQSQFKSIYEYVNKFDGIYKLLAAWLAARNITPDEYISTLMKYENNKRFDKTKLSVQPTYVIMDGLKYEDGPSLEDDFASLELTEYIHSTYPILHIEMKAEKNDLIPVLEGDGIKIYEVRDVHESRAAGAGTTWCIAYPASNNLWQSYRDSVEATFFIVHDENPPTSEQRRVAVDFNNREVSLTDIPNSTGTRLSNGMDWNEYKKYLISKNVPVDATRINPKTNQEELVLKNKPFTDQEYLQKLTFEMLSRYEALKLDTVNLWNQNRSIIRKIKSQEGQERYQKLIQKYPLIEDNNNGEVVITNPFSKFYLSNWIGVGNKISDKVLDYILQAANGKELLLKYVSTGVPIPKEHFEKISLNKNLANTYIFKYTQGLEIMGYWGSDFDNNGIMDYLIANRDEKRIFDIFVKVENIDVSSYPEFVKDIYDKSLLQNGGFYNQHERLSFDNPEHIEFINNNQPKNNVPFFQMVSRDPRFIKIPRIFRRWIYENYTVSSDIFNQMSDVQRKIFIVGGGQTYYELDVVNDFIKNHIDLYMFDIDEVNKLISEIQNENPDYISLLQKNLDDRNLFPAYSKTENLQIQEAVQDSKIGFIANDAKTFTEIYKVLVKAPSENVETDDTEYKNYLKNELLDKFNLMPLIAYIGDEIFKYFPELAENRDLWISWIKIDWIYSQKRNQKHGYKIITFMPERFYDDDEILNLLINPVNKDEMMTILLTKDTFLNHPKLMQRFLDFIDGDSNFYTIAEIPYTNNQKEWVKAVYKKLMSKNREYYKDFYNLEYVQDPMMYLEVYKEIFAVDFDSILDAMSSNKIDKLNQKLSIYSIDELFTSYRDVMNKLMSMMPLKFNALLRKRAWEEFPELKDSIIEKESAKYGVPDYFDEELGEVVQGSRSKKQMPEIDKPEIVEEIPQVPNEENTDVLAHLSSVVKVAKILDLKNRYYFADKLTKYLGKYNV